MPDRPTSFEKDKNIFDSWRAFLKKDNQATKNILNEQEIVGSMAADKPIAKVGDFADEAEAEAAALTQPEGAPPRKMVNPRDLSKPRPATHTLGRHKDPVTIQNMQKLTQQYRSGEIDKAGWEKGRSRVMSDEEHRHRETPEFDDLGYVAPEFSETGQAEYWTQDEDGIPITLTMGGEGGTLPGGGSSEKVGVGLEADFMTGKTDLPSAKALKDLGYMDNAGRLTAQGRSYALSRWKEKQRQAKIAKLKKDTILGGIPGDRPNELTGKPGWEETIQEAVIQEVYNRLIKMMRKEG